MRVSIDMSGACRGFLVSRVAAGKEDAALASAFAYHQINVDDEDAHNFYDVKTVEGEPRISYSTINRLKALPNYPFCDGSYEPGGHRTVARPARVAQRVTGVKDGRALDVFTTALAAWLSPQCAVRIVQGREITKRYNQRHHCTCLEYLGDLTNSCMRHGFRKRFGLYEDHAQLAVILCPECGGTQVRALLWTDVEGVTWLDRVYGPERLAERLRQWAAQQGYESCWAGGMGKAIDRRIVVAAPRKNYPEAPYLDSLFNWCRDCGELSNHLGALCEERRHDWVHLSGVEGTSHAGWYGYCPDCGTPYEEGYGRRCHSGGWCRQCLDYDEPLCTVTMTCARGHRACRICGQAVGADGECEHGCVVCPHCANGIRARDLRLRHGRSCPYCGDALVLTPTQSAGTMPLTVSAIMESVYHFRTVCACDRHIAGYQQHALARCASSHPDDAGCRGHCPSCGRPLVLEYGAGSERERGRPLPRSAAPDYSVTASILRETFAPWGRLSPPRHDFVRTDPGRIQLVGDGDFTEPLTWEDVFLTEEGEDADEADAA